MGQGVDSESVDKLGLVALAKLCARLAKVRSFSFNASNGPGSATNWRGHGRGDVAVENFGAHTVFNEQAKFTDVDGHKVALNNCYRWTRCVDFVRLEHVQDEQSMLLFNFVPLTAHGFRHQNAHQCGADTYTADLILHTDEIELIWQIHGPQKNERLHYHYW